MIEVTLSNGDWAEADTPEAAMLAARTLWEDATDGTYFGRAADLTATFKVDGKISLAGISRNAMLAA